MMAAWTRGGSWGDEKWSGPRYLLKVEPKWFEFGVREKGNSEGYQDSMVWTPGRMGSLFSEMGQTRGRTDLTGKIRVLLWIAEG